MFDPHFLSLLENNCFNELLNALPVSLSADDIDLVVSWVTQLTKYLEEELICHLLSHWQNGTIPDWHVNLLPMPCIPNIPKPKYAIAQSIRWIPFFEDDDPDTGKVIGRFWCYAAHLRSWQWCYLIWLDANAPGAMLCPFDIAWEIDVEGSLTVNDLLTIAHRL